MHSDLWVVGTSLDAQIAIGPFGIELVGGEVRQSLQRIGLPVGEPKPTLAVLAEQRRTKPEGDRQPCRRQTDGLASVVRWCRVRARSRSGFSGTQALRHACCGGGPVLEELHQFLAGVRDHIKGSEVQSILDRGEDARLMLAVEGIGARSWQVRRRCGLLASQRKTTG